ncbi:Sugar kinase of the NBD/HSP70 family, may contain an N-terminal HTH domain [Amycolatopsis pretoriensis]|uniref:Sugar kinase of the NBD/HSP70 family, may contain an N-terminal HTH domain n=1 Tax=Amycolatopsis pretoriensis TaxID=218821 RepID=A0A1H5QNI2_9PSEU|nr:ROK family protein [Amycolatopsis pretoriensis]SEF27692.1 Sugar kinase of the NBD/HSP70 family, may contain an N-terminal HTH domain [Amycolatopsis pretoriensis]
MGVPAAETIRTVLWAICVDGASNRVAIAGRSGTARSTVASTVEFLIAQGVLVERDVHDGSRGRPARELALGPRSPLAGIVAFTPGATIAAISDLHGIVRSRRVVRNALSIGPETAVDTAALMIDEMIEQQPAQSRVELVVASIGAPVNVRTGSVVRSNNRSGPVSFPSLGWEDFPVASYLSRVLGAPAILENDVHLLTIGDGVGVGRDRLPLVRLHASIGLGAGFLDSDGQLFRGVGGVAGDVAHLVLESSSKHVCWCGKRGCISQTATIHSIGRDLGLPAPAGDQRLPAVLREAVANHDESAVQRIRDAADAVGRLAAVLVDVLNPGRLVLSGELLHLGSDALTRIRTAVFERALPSASRHVDVTVATDDEDGTLPGAARLAADRMLSDPAALRMMRVAGAAI